MPKDIMDAVSSDAILWICVFLPMLLIKEYPYLFTLCKLSSISYKWTCHSSTRPVCHYWMSIRSMSYSLLLAGLFLGLPYIYLLPTKTGVSLPVRLVVAVDKHPHHESLFASERVLLPNPCTMQNIASYFMSGKFVTFLLLCQASL